MANVSNLSISLWFDGQAEEAANYYVSIFKTDSRIDRTLRYTDVGKEIHGHEAGSVLTVEFHIGNMNFVALNGGPDFKFNESLSIVVDCKSQEEIDYYWESLGAGGDEKARECGWLKDKFGLSWQIVPVELNEMLEQENSEEAKRVMAAMLKMKKLDIAELKKAYEG